MACKLTIILVWQVHLNFMFSLLFPYTTYVFIGVYLYLIDKETVQDESWEVSGSEGR